MINTTTVRTLVLLTGLLLCTLARADLTLGVHAEEPAPTIGALIARLTPGEQALTIRAYDSSAELADALMAGDVDLGIIEDTGRMLPGLTLVSDLYPSVLHVLHRQDNKPKDLGELLRSGPIWAGAPGSLGHHLAEQLAEDFGIAEGEITLLPDPWSREPDIYFMFGGILARDALSRLPGFTLYSLDAPEKLMHGSVAEGVALRYPFLHPFTLPAQLYPSLGGDAALTLSVNNLLVARAGLDTELVYELARGLDNLRPQITAGYPLAGVPVLFDVTQMAQSLPLHPGARRYRDRDLPGFLERYAEVLGFLATVVIASGSVLVAVRRQRKQSRKDRLDIYYQKILDLRRSLEQSASGSDEICNAVRDTQAEVMALVIDERIDADGSLMAFLTLSNRLLDEAGETKEGPGVAGRISQQLPRAQ